MNFANCKMSSKFFISHFSESIMRSRGHVSRPVSDPNLSTTSSNVSFFSVQMRIYTVVSDPNLNLSATPKLQYFTLPHILQRTPADSGGLRWTQHQNYLIPPFGPLWMLESSGIHWILLDSSIQTTAVG